MPEDAQEGEDEDLEMVSAQMPQGRLTPSGETHGRRGSSTSGFALAFQELVCIVRRQESQGLALQEEDLSGDVDGAEATQNYRFSLRDSPVGEYSVVHVGQDSVTKLVLAHVVPFKGGWVCEQVIRDLR